MAVNPRIDGVIAAVWVVLVYDNRRRTQHAPDVKDPIRHDAGSRRSSRIVSVEVLGAEVSNERANLVAEAARRDEGGEGW